MAVEDRLIALEQHLRSTEDRIRTDFRERDRAWLEHARKGMMLIARMIVEATSSTRDRLREPLVGLSGELLMPDLEARAINVEEYRAHAPEKFELLGGYLFDSAEHPASRHRLLNLLLVLRVELRPAYEPFGVELGESLFQLRVKAREVQLVELPEIGAVGRVHAIEPLSRTWGQNGAWSTVRSARRPSQYSGSWFDRVNRVLKSLP